MSDVEKGETRLTSLETFTAYFHFSFLKLINSFFNLGIDNM